jgi:Sel1 repeat
MSDPQYIYVKEKTKTGCLTQVIGAFLILVLVGFIISLVLESNNSSNTGSKTSDVSNVAPAVEVSEIHAKGLEFGGMEITGIVKNKCLTSLNGLSIRFSVFDSNGNKIGEAFDLITDLDAGGTWKFTATASESGSFRSEGVWCTRGQLLVKYLDEERRQQREKDAAIEQERQTLAAEAAQRLAIQNYRASQQESARKTFEFYSQKAANGDAFAQLRLGQLYLAGQGVETNVEQARFWLFRAATNGRAEAANLLLSLPASR